MTKFKAQPSPAEVITSAIVARLEAGVRPWVRPWRSSALSRPLRATGEPYRGINCAWLWMCADAEGYSAPTWMTYKQSLELGGQVRKGEHSRFAIFYKKYTNDDKEESGENRDNRRYVLRVYRVFNVEQIDHLPASYYPERSVLEPPSDTLTSRAERFLDRLPAKLQIGGNRAYYNRHEDRIFMPPLEVFPTRASWVSTWCHEAAHWTGHPDRLNRHFGKKFGDAAYSYEELVAELAAAFLGSDLGLPAEHIEDHASYIKSWLSILKKDSRAILHAAAKAEAAVSYLLHAAGMEAADDTVQAA